MNEFTKEELKIIYLNLCVNEKTKDVLNKVRAMIDNYCEHEHTIEYRLPTPVNVLFSDKECKFFVCKKCFRCVVYE